MHPKAICIFLLVSSTVAMSNALLCYTCGKYQEEGGSILPCHKSSFGELISCKESDQYCMKYVNAGITVRQCIQSCDENKSSGTTQFYCCKEDTCNSGLALQPPFQQAIIAASTTVVLTICLWWL